MGVQRKNIIMSNEAIEFYRWMIKNDTVENAETYFHWSDEDMFNEFLKQKQKYKSSTNEDKTCYGEDNNNK